MGTNKRSLDGLARHYGTDKSSTGHNFTPIYENLLGHRRDQALKILEIGVYEGAGLRMWRDYFPIAQIVGIELNPAAVRYRANRIQIYIGNQAEPEFMEEVASDEGPFDLVVDDGGHRAAQQRLSLMALWPHLSRGGTYAIEDIHTSYYESYEMGWRKPDTTVELLKSVIDDVHARIHRQPTTLEELESIHFFSELCVMQKKGQSL